MSKALRITFLGTGTSMGVPVIACKCHTCQSADPRDNRLRSSILIQYCDKNFIIDSGPDFRYQSLRAGVEHLNALIFTHEHKDHIAGMDDVRAFNFIANKAVDIYASANVEKALRNEFHYVFAELKYPGVPEVNIRPIRHDQPFEIEGLRFVPILVYHHKLPVLGFRINDFTYITDASFIPDEEWVKIEGTRTLVINALRIQDHLSHFTLAEAIDVVNRVKPERAFFTHISHQMGRHAEVSVQLPEGIELAYDMLSIVV